MSDVPKLTDYRDEPMPKVSAIKTLIESLKQMVDASTLVQSEDYKEMVDALDFALVICMRHELGNHESRSGR